MFLDTKAIHLRGTMHVHVKFVRMARPWAAAQGSSPVVQSNDSWHIIFSSHIIEETARLLDPSAENN